MNKRCEAFRQADKVAGPVSWINHSPASLLPTTRDYYGAAATQPWPRQTVGRSGLWLMRSRSRARSLSRLLSEAHSFDMRSLQRRTAVVDVDVDALRLQLRERRLGTSSAWHGSSRSPSQSLAVPLRAPPHLGLATRDLAELTGMGRRRTTHDEREDGGRTTAGRWRPVARSPQLMLRRRHLRCADSIGQERGRLRTDKTWPVRPPPQD